MSTPNQRYSSVPEVTVRAETLRNVTHWTPPTPAEISEVLNRAGIKWDSLAAITGNPSNRVTAWRNGAKEIDYLAWRYVCERAGYGRIDE